MSERENGWYLRSDGYMTSECSYQRIEAMKGNRALDNHQKLVFIKYMGGEEKDSRVYIPHPGTCELTETDSYSNANEVIHVLECSACGETCEHVNGSYPRCPHCGRKVVSA